VFLAHKKANGIYTKAFILFLALVMMFSSFAATSYFQPQTVQAETGERPPRPDLPHISAITQLEEYFLNISAEWDSSGIPLAQEEIVIQAKDFRAKSDDAQISIGTFMGRNDTLIWENQRGWIEFEVDVPQTALYEFEINYYPFHVGEGGSRRAVQMSTTINGEFPFREARSLDFYREFKDQWPLRMDDDGHQMRPLMEEIQRWKVQSFRDAEGSYALPLRWKLNEGRNVIRLNLISEPVGIDTLTLKPPTVLKSYAEVKETYTGLRHGQGLMIFEAQEMATKNETSLQVNFAREPLATPTSYDKIRYNTVGGWRWFRNAQKATWEIVAPEEGLYKIALRGIQNFHINRANFRAVYINGEIPFEEVKNYKFQYENRWREFILSDENGEPFLFHLKEGVNTLALQAIQEPYMPIIAEITDLSMYIRQLALDLRAVTGGRQDGLRRWNVDDEIPHLVPTLQFLQYELNELSQKMLEINGQRDNVVRSLASAAADITTLLRKPNEIPNRELNIGSLQESIEQQRNDLFNKPLQLDKIYIAGPDEELSNMRASFFQRLSGTLQSFYYSFFDRDMISRQNPDELQVWFMFGRDYVNELQHLANERFTPEYGVKVRVNLIQQPELLILANAAGIMPHVAMGVPGELPFDMALRGAALDLSQLEGADEVFARYTPGALMPFYYDGGMYAIPETMTFKMMFYRTDLMDFLGLEPPDTWDDVYEMFPTLVQNNFNFYMEPRDFSVLFYQNGINLYTDDGLSTGLDTPVGFQTFRQWTELFTIFGMERQVASFYNQFRRGLLPIGIADFNTYMLLLVAAPELRGFWEIAPIPGIVNEQGEIERWSGGVPDIAGTSMSSANIAGSSMTAVMLFEHEDKEMQNMAWEFAKWYTSTEIQTEFGTNLENFFGEQFRWNAANIEAFAQMPWNPDDLNKILDQWRWFKDFPNTPGSYMSGREINFAWIRTVIDGENYRTSWQKAIREINRELIRKQIEFDLRDESGRPTRTLELLDIREPWNEVDRFVR
jgi:ABC-type glycerol-3-phosphate transport system substrate-binding protein